MLGLLTASVSYTASPAEAAYLVPVEPPVSSLTLVSATNIPDPTITLCSCVKYARTLLPGLPLIHSPADLKPNTRPAPGVAVLLDYELPHIAIVTKLEDGGFWVEEANYRMCQKTARFIRWDDLHLRGFWSSAV